jgi:signal transduction histidine kinase
MSSVPRRRFGSPRAALARVSGLLDGLPIRARLAAVSTALTFVILCGFAVVVGELTVHRIRSDFNRQVAAAATDLDNRLSVYPVFGHPKAVPDINVYASPNHAVIRILGEDGTPFLTTTHAPNLGTPLSPTAEINGYRVETRAREAASGGTIYIQYARRISDVDATIARVRLLLLLGVLGGTGLALMAGLMLARRAMAPITRLTATAGEIARTRDPSRSVPVPDADDEVAELARTFDEMLRSLDGARAETQSMLDQQRRFVADASHELRTPLTSVLANLELLADSLRGDEGDAARSALRSSRRMRRLVADLLLLARADVGREQRHEPVDLARVLVEAASELGPLSENHDITLDARPVKVLGARDDLLRLTINLVENAVRHTPPGTRVSVMTAPGPGHTARLIVEDDGPGIPPELAPRLFERFVRGAGDRGGSSGLGLAIVRAVAEAHGGGVALEVPEGGGTRFVVALPALPATLDPADERASTVGSSA